MFISQRRSPEIDPLFSHASNLVFLIYNYRLHEKESTGVPIIKYEKKKKKRKLLPRK